MEARVQRAYNRLEADTLDGKCGMFLSSLGELERLTIYNRLEFERLERKHNDLLKLYSESDECWNQTLFTAILMNLSCPKNKMAFKKLAQRVSYKNILRERGTPNSAEALLLGASGILELYPKDGYINKLKFDAEFIMHKYHIEPLDSSEWVFENIRPANHPVIRLAQVAKLLSTNDYLFNGVIKCKTQQDVVALFRVKASDYWITHYIPGRESKSDESKVKRIGTTKCNLIGVNVVTTMQYAYGMQIGDEDLTTNAEELLEKLNAEDNTYIKTWKKYGVRPRSAFDTQALIQLYTEYCKKQLCQNCPVGRRAVNNLSWIQDYK